ncbi:MAG: ribonuclease III [Parcubacteria group bacterium Athens1014_10]|nr:MAG: ribonuclease III [Parcubacteria group bacterium Athens1014_10]TSD05939.1 MAG: ribonuclease III [Parcubacteria group bacterium Athens0714_12]
MKDFSKLEKILGLKFKDKNLLSQSLVHRSYLNEHPNFHLEHNERLEFLGDAVLELIVTEYLYKNYKNPEGDLTNWRAALVNAKTLSVLAKDLDLGQYLYLSKGEAKDKGKAREYILADGFEALVGAIFLDQGLKKTFDFIEKKLIFKLPHILKHELHIDPKTKFQEISQEKFKITPIYNVLEESGPDHAKYFKIGVFLEDKLIASGEGMSKQEAQVKAAENALKKKKW